MANQIQLRRDTEANWTSVDPVLAEGEAGFDLTNNELRIGDGVKTWSQLEGISGGGDGFVEVAGDNMTGALTIGPEGGPAVTTLGDDGSATFTGKVTAEAFDLEALDELGTEPAEDDILLINRNGESFKIGAQDFIGSITPPGKVATPTILTPPDGAGVGGDVTYTPKTSAITNVSGDLITLTDGNTYDADTGEDRGTPISQTFTAGQTVRGVKAGSPTAVGTLTANAVDNTMTVTASADPGFEVSLAPEDNGWTSVTYGDGKFVALSNSGTNPIMWTTDPAGPWTAVTAPAAGADSLDRWRSITYGNGKFVAVSSAGTNRVMWAADPAGPWTVAAVPEANGWFSVTYGDGKFVAVSIGGTNRIMWATDPAGPWAAVAAAEDNPWYSVAYGNGKFVAVANMGTNQIMWATDPAGPWNPVTPPEDSSWYSVTYGDGKFVAVAQAGTNQIMWATDPAGPWTVAAAPEANAWSSITHGDGKFVAVSYSGTNQILWAADPAGSWNLAAAPEANVWRAVTYGNGKFVAVANSGTNRVMYGEFALGASFVEGMEVINDTEVTEHAPGAADIVFTSSVPEAETGTINTWGNAEWEISTDQSTWDGTPIPIVPDAVQTVPAGTFSLADGTDYYARVKYTSTDPAVISNYSPVVHFKTADGSSGWVLATDPTGATNANAWKDAAYGDGKYVAVASNGSKRVMVSVDGGDSWTAYTAAGDAKQIIGINYINGLWFGTGNSLLMTSADAINWTEVDLTGLPTSLRQVAFGNGVYVAVSSTAPGIMYSTNGTSWTIATSDPGNHGYDKVIFADNKFVAVGSFGNSTTAVYSSDGINWSAGSGVTEQGWGGLAHANGTFVAVSFRASQRVMTSPDGMNWTQRASADDTKQWYDVATDGSRFVAVSADDGTSQTMYSDDNGVTWRLSDPAALNSWQGITYGGGKFLAVAGTGDNRVMYSVTGKSSARTRLLYDTAKDKVTTDIQLERKYGINPDTYDLSILGIAELTEQPTYAVEGYLPVGDKYKPLRDYTAEMEELAEARARLAALESDEISDDAVDSALITLVGSLNARLTALENGLN